MGENVLVCVCVYLYIYIYIYILHMLNCGFKRMLVLLVVSSSGFQYYAWVARGLCINAC